MGFDGPEAWCCCVLGLGGLYTGNLQTPLPYLPFLGPKDSLSPPPPPKKATVRMSVRAATPHLGVRSDGGELGTGHRLEAREQLLAQLSVRH